jgi:NAD(P)-dependent dehydrogenase (short-subunit alcohol dehydrogenase family)
MTDAVALVTGGGRGIGRSTAELLVSRGMTVVAVSRTERELRSLKDSVGADYIVASVETEQACESIVEQTLRRHGPGKVDESDPAVGARKICGSAA